MAAAEISYLNQCSTACDMFLNFLSRVLKTGEKRLYLAQDVALIICSVDAAWRHLQLVVAKVHRRVGMLP